MSQKHGRPDDPGPGQASDDIANERFAPSERYASDRYASDRYASDRYGPDRYASDRYGPTAGVGSGTGDAGPGAYRGDDPAGRRPAGADGSGGSDPATDPGGADGEDDEGDEGARGFAGTVLAGLRELVIVVVLALALSFVVKTWLFQAFYIPSGSMEDTLVRDDRVIVSKLTPGPFDLVRGDVVVFEDPGLPEAWLAGIDPTESAGVGGPFHDALVFVGLLPEDAENHLIKRVIGLPGDRVQSDGTTGDLRVNGVSVSESYLKPGVAPSEGKAFNIVVPQGKVWVMGDNRSNSSDSRYHDNGTGRDGSVPIDKIVGRALFIVWPIDRVTWLGVPERTFEQVPLPTATRPAVRPSATKPAAKPAATKPAAKPAAPTTTRAGG